MNLKQLFEETHHIYDLKLLAGEGGLQRNLNWVYVAEDPSNAGFLRADELVISTAAMYDHSEKWLLDFVKSLSAHDTGGLILNVGRYLIPEDITPEVLSFCNENNFPLLTMPWRIHISDITKDYYDRIIQDARADRAIALRQLLGEVTNQEMLRRYVDQHLHDLLEYDAGHHTDLARTLYDYLLFWGSTQAIATARFCHRNTITNRMALIREQFSFDLENPQKRYELLTAFVILEYLAHSEK